MIHVIH